MKKAKVALIGANGQLGSDIVKFFRKKNFFRIIPLTIKDFDVTNQSQTEKVLEKIKPQILINTAAFHNVDEVENDPEKGFLVNAIAEENLAQLCQKNNWTIVFISTDFVFGQDEKRRKPYTEKDLPGPVSIYGLTKLAGEHLTRYCLRHFIIRTAVLYGAKGPAGKGENFVDLMIRLAKERGTIKVVTDQIISPTYTKNLAENIHALLKTKKYGLYHMVSKGHCSRYQFTKEILKLTKIKAKCLPAVSYDFPTPARRPAYSAMKNSELEKIGLNKMKAWQQNLKDYLKEKGYL